MASLPPTSALRAFQATVTPNSTPVSQVRFVVFGISHLTLALPIVAVTKVVNLGTIEGSGQSAWGVMTVDDRPCTVIDLHQYLFHRPLNPDQAPHYLVLTALATGELLGIPASDTPRLIDVPSDLVRLLPSSYRKADTLAVASHIAHWTDPATEAEQTFFVLDVNSLMESQAWW
ncbi:MAG: chemotaxis protein CheW [Prochlorothrix sp.]|nr:chemotaxis protein CheW [Prochlorothrix sp.]